MNRLTNTSYIEYQPNISIAILDLPLVLSSGFFSSAGAGGVAVAGGVAGAGVAGAGPNGYHQLCQREPI